MLALRVLTALTLVLMPGLAAAGQPVTFPRVEAVFPDPTPPAKPFIDPHPFGFHKFHHPFFGAPIIFFVPVPEDRVVIQPFVPKIDLERQVAVTRKPVPASVPSPPTVEDFTLINDSRFDGLLFLHPHTHNGIFYLYDFHPKNPPFAGAGHWSSDGTTWTWIPE